MLEFLFAYPKEINDLAGKDRQWLLTSPKERQPASAGKNNTTFKVFLPKSKSWTKICSNLGLWGTQDTEEQCKRCHQSVTSRIQIRGTTEKIPDFCCQP